MPNHKINPILSNAANILLPNFIFPTIEYQKENLTESSYIFTPNHTNNLDGYLILSLLSKDYDIDTFMYKEFWDNYPIIAKVLPLLNVYPITRDKINIQELKTELQKLKEENHSLIIFPQGRHVDPEVMLHLPEYHLNTLPLGAFYFDASSLKSIVPIYIEPQKAFSKNVVVYGKPINPTDYDVIRSNGRVNKANLLHLAKEWLTEINNSYEIAQKLDGRKMRQYMLREKYFDASGLHSNLNDPNIIVNYLDEVKKLNDLSLKTGITNIQELGNILEIKQEIITQIQEVEKTYQNNLVRGHKKKGAKMPLRLLIK